MYAIYRTCIMEQPRIFHNMLKHGTMGFKATVGIPYYFSIILGMTRAEGTLNIASLYVYLAS